MGSDSIHQRVYNGLGIRFTFLPVYFKFFYPSYFYVLSRIQIAFSRFLRDSILIPPRCSGYTGEGQNASRVFLDKRGLTRVMDQ